MRSIAVGFTDNPLDFLELFHEMQLSGQAPCCIDHYDICPSCSTGVHSVKRHCCRVSAILRDDGHVIPLAPNYKLLARRCAKGITGGKQNRLTLPLEGVG